MFTADQLVAHAVGDYLLQSHWMATEKTRRSFAAFVHVVFYSVPFLFFLSPSWLALAVIAGSHFIIDRWRLARYVVYIKNLWAPQAAAHHFIATVNVDTGYPEEAPSWLAVWLLIICDNLLHIIINGLALRYL